MRKLLHKHAIRWTCGIVIAVLACAQALNYLHSDFIERLDLYLYDLRIKVQEPELDKRIVIVDIDEKSLVEVGRFPWSRNVLADLVNKLTQNYQVKAIGFDIQFSEPDTSSGYVTLDTLANTDLKGVPDFRKKLDQLKPALDYDQLFANALKDKPVVLGYSFSERQKKGVLPPPVFKESDLQGRLLFASEEVGYDGNLAILQNAARAGGFFNEELDADGVMRTVPLIIRSGDGFYESLALSTARVALGATEVRPKFIADATQDYGVLEALVLNAKPRNKTIPVEELIKIQIDYRGKGGPEGGGYKYVSATDVLHGRVPPADLMQRIVLVGTSAPGLNDLRIAPMNNQYPGVEAHANVIASILDGHFKQRPDYVDALNIVQLVVVATLLIIGLTLLAPLASVLYSAAVAAAIIGSNFWAYREHDMVLPAATTLLLILALLMLNLGWGYWFEYRKGRAMTSLFGEYVAPELVEEMADDPQHYTMEGEKRELTILFADVRGFTTISEELEPNDLREYINMYLTAMSNNIRENRGTLDKYIGDSVMAFWGAPVRLADHASRAVATALIMQQSADKLNTEFQNRGWPALHIGVGINTGEVRVGDMGSKIRRAYTVMGDAVNLASRLEGITKQYGVGIVVGELTKRATPEFAYRELDLVRVKGKNAAVAIFEPIGLSAQLDDATRHALEGWHAALTLFRNQQWDDAELQIKALQAQGKNLKLYELYLHNIAYFRENPPAADWDGVTTYTTK